MAATQTFPGPIAVSWRELVMPKEHGSWSLAFEPVALGLLCAPSLGGGFLAVAIAAAFLCRRPLRTAWRDPRPDRRRAAWNAFIRCAAVAAVGFGGAVMLGNGFWMAWLVPSAVLGAFFLHYDLRNGGREEVAEIAGAAAFGMLPAAFAALAGVNGFGAAALALVMTGRAVPTVVFVRAAVRGRKEGRFDFRAALWTAYAALGLAVVLVWAGYVPLAALYCFLFFVARVVAVRARPNIRPKKLGMFEALAGIGFVVVMGLSWAA